MTFTFADPAEWWLEIPPSVQAESWHYSQSSATTISRQTAYLNRLCLNVFLPWLRDEYAPEAAPYPAVRTAQEIWELVTGTAIVLGNKRLVIIPTESLDQGELEVPQEWVDLPTWAGDYYLAVQVKPEGEWMRIWGYTTHLDLKANSRYDPGDRTYCLDAQALVNDMNVFWVTFQLCPDARTQAALEPLPTIPIAQAEPLIERLGNPSLMFPRLAVPFSLWGALLEQPEWLRRLCQRRQGLQGTHSTAESRIKLGDWLRNQIILGWQSLESLREGQAAHLAPSFRIASGFEDDEIRQVKSLSFAYQTVTLLVGLHTEADERIGIRIQIHPGEGERYVPANLTLTLLSEDGEELQSVQSEEQDFYIQLNRFRCSPGTAFSLQVALGDDCITENFLV